MATINQGESSNLTITLYDLEDPAVAITKAQIASLTLTLKDERTGTVINSREDQDILDDNGGTVAADGVITLRLDGDDSPNVGNLAVGQTEIHVATVSWTWNDGVSTRTGSKEYPLTILINSEVTSTTGWLG